MNPIHTAFAKREGPGIRTARNTYWAGNHPKHGAKPKGTQKAAAAADALRGDHALEGYFVQRFSPLCWATHGSEPQAVRGIGVDAFPRLMGEAIRDAAAFEMLSADRALTYLGAMTPELAAEIDGTHELRNGARMLGFIVQRHGLAP